MMKQEDDKDEYANNEVEKCVPGNLSQSQAAKDLWSALGYPDMESALNY